MKNIIKRLEKGFYKACDSFSNGLYVKKWKYNDVGALAFKLSLICIILLLIILGLVIALIFL